jgi:hypothetical protein
MSEDPKPYFHFSGHGHNMGNGSAGKDLATTASDVHLASDRIGTIRTAIFVGQENTTLTIQTADDALQLVKMGTKGKPIPLRSGVNKVTVGAGLFKVVSTGAVRVTADTAHLEVLVTPNDESGDFSGETGRSRGWSFLTTGTPEEAAKAIEGMDVSKRHSRLRISMHRSPCFGGVIQTLSSRWSLPTSMV